jgi:peptidoglycan/xylan/chitin deacetylase (PgdA/CDA1 family)
LGSLLFIANSTENKIAKIPTEIPYRKDAIKFVSLITPYPTISLTPTPIPLTGYCLHVPILMYHHIQPEATAKDLGQTSLTVDSGVFDGQMAYLAANGYTTIWASDLIDALNKHTGLSGKPVLITMDDGYADNDTYALPVLRKYNLKANLMLASGLVGSNSDMLTWGQVNDMKGSGLFYFTNHTWSHWPISKGPQDKIDSEIDTAQTQIQQYTGQTVNTFTYPYGSFNNNAIETLQRKGYVGAFSEIPGQYQCDSFIMTLHRTRIGNGSLASYGI